jgi:hypothetical protein
LYTVELNPEEVIKEMRAPADRAWVEYEIKAFDMDAFVLKELRLAQFDAAKSIPRIYSHGSLSTDVGGWDDCHFQYSSSGEEKTFEQPGPAAFGRSKYICYLPKKNHFFN